MAEIRLWVPDALSDLPAEELEAHFRAGLDVAAAARIRHLEQEVAEVRDHIDAFETRHGMSLERFTRDLLPHLDAFDAHETYNDWTFWHRVAEEKQQLLGCYRRLSLS